MKFRLCLVALAVFSLSLLCRADTFSGNAAFHDISSSGHEVSNFVGNFYPSPTFSFSGAPGTVFTDPLTVVAFGGVIPGDTFKVAVNFTAPNPESATFNGNGVAYFVGYFGLDNDIDWTSNVQTVLFSDGSALQLQLPNFHYEFGVLTGPFGAETQNLTMTVLAPVPEPSGLLLLGTGILCLAGLMRLQQPVIANDPPSPTTCHPDAGGIRICSFLHTPRTAL